MIGEVFVCSNPRCRAVFAHDPRGHCPECITANGVGFSTVRVRAHDYDAEEAARIRNAKTAPPPAPPPVDRSQRTLVDGSPVTPDHHELKPNGQQKDYVVLSAEERAKGFVRPVRQSYRHVGIPGPKHPVRDLTDEERERYSNHGYVKFEVYPTSEAPKTCRFWTQAELDKIGQACGTVTTMGMAIAETYARDPRFYGATFCCGCGTHLPVGAHGEFVWDDGNGERVGT